MTMRLNFAIMRNSGDLLSIIIKEEETLGKKSGSDSLTGLETVLKKNFTCIFLLPKASAPFRLSGENLRSLSSVV